MFQTRPVHMNTVLICQFKMYRKRRSKSNTETDMMSAPCNGLDYKIYMR